MADQPPKPADTRIRRPVDKAFDTWLNQGLHELFDGIANEPIPEELLKLIEDKREKQ